MTGRKRDRSRRPGAGVVSLRVWLKRRAEVAVQAGCPMLNIRVVRTSSSDVEQWQASALTSFAAMEREGDPDVITAQAHGMDLVRRDAVGKKKRKALGDSVFELQMSHAPGGVGYKRIGVLLHVGSTMFVYLLTSARADNLLADSDDRRGNAATELISAVVRTTYTVGRAYDPAFRPHVYAREHERIIRDERHGTDLKETFTQCRVIAHIPHRIDLLSPGEASSFTFGTLMSSAAVEAIVRGMNRSEVVMQVNGGYYLSVKQLPFTHEAATTLEVDPRTGATYPLVHKHRLAVVADVATAKSTLRIIVDSILEDRIDELGRARPEADWEAIAVLPVVMSLDSREPADLKKGIKLRDKPVTARVASLKSLFSEKWIEGWRTQFITQDVPMKVELNLDLGDAVEIVEKDGKRYYRCKVPIPAPEDGWGITEEEWEEVLRRRYPQKGKRRRTDNCYPLTGIGWDAPEDDLEWRLVTQDRYLLGSRCLSASFTEKEERWGWKTGPSVTYHATMTPREFHRSVAAEAEKALVGVDRPTRPVLMRTLDVVAPDPVAFAEEAREGLEEALAIAEDTEVEATAELNRARAVLNRAERSTDEAKKKEAKRKVRAAEKALELATEARHGAESDLERVEAGAKLPQRQGSVAPTEVDVFTATAEFAVASLYECVGVAPPWLYSACTAMFRDWRLKVIKQTGVRDQVAWSCSLVLDIAGDRDGETQVHLPINGQVDSSSYRTTSAGATGVEDWAWRFFYLGESFAQVGTAAVIDGSGKKHTWLYKSLLEWLEPAIPDVYLRNAALACPIPETKRVFWWMVTGDRAALAGINPGFVAHIERTYGGTAARPKWSWCRDTHINPRLVARSLSRDPRGQKPIHLLLAETQLGRDEILATARKAGKSTHPDGGRRTLPPVSYFEKSFERGPGRRVLVPEDRYLALRPCPWDDCPARARGEQAYASVVLNVPETDQWYAVLCPECRRLSHEDMAAVRFPHNYLRPWSGHFGTHSTKTGARNQQAWTFIDPSFDDPGTGPALPEVGTQPRPAPGCPASRRIPAPRPNVRGHASWRPPGPSRRPA